MNYMIHPTLISHNGFANNNQIACEPTSSALFCSELSFHPLRELSCSLPGCASDVWRVPSPCSPRCFPSSPGLGVVKLHHLLDKSGTMCFLTVLSGWAFLAWVAPGSLLSGTFLLQGDNHYKQSLGCERVFAPYRNCLALPVALRCEKTSRKKSLMPCQYRLKKHKKEILFYFSDECHELSMNRSSQCFGVASEHESSVSTGFSWDSKELWVPEKASCAVGSPERAGVLTGSCVAACAPSSSSFFPLPT